MSIAIMSMVWKRFAGTSSETFLALSLADHADDEGRRIFPSVAHMAQRTRQSERAVQYQLRRLEEMGWLQLVAKEDRSRGLCREYRINPEWVAGNDLTPPEDGKGANFAPIEDDDPGASISPGRVQITTVPGAPIAPQSSLIIIEPRGAKKSRPVPPDYRPPEKLIAEIKSRNPGIDVVLQTKRFINHHIAKGNTFKDIDRAWWNWVSEAFVRPKPRLKAGELSPGLAL